MEDSVVCIYLTMNSLPPSLNQVTKLRQSTPPLVHEKVSQCIESMCVYVNFFLFISSQQTAKEIGLQM